MPEETPRSRVAREAAEQALVRVVHHYGGRPEFVLLGGLVPELLCSGSEFHHAGTTDVDVQVDLEISCGSVNARRLEHALRNAEFTPDNEQVWRWAADGPIPRTIVRFELLTDLNDVPAESTVNFEGCEQLGAVNLRGTGYAARDIEVRQLVSRVGGVEHTAEINITGLAGFLLAKCAAARSRRIPKDWYDIAFVLIHNDAGGVVQAVERVREQFEEDLAAMRSTLDDLLANFTNEADQGPRAYAEQMSIDHPELDRPTLSADAVVAIGDFHRGLFPN